MGEKMVFVIGRFELSLNRRWDLVARSGKSSHPCYLLIDNRQTPFSFQQTCLIQLCSNQIVECSTLRAPKITRRVEFRLHAAPELMITRQPWGQFVLVTECSTVRELRVNTEVD